MDNNSFSESVILPLSLHPSLFPVVQFIYSIVTLVLPVTITGMTCTFHIQLEREVEVFSSIHNVWKMENILILLYIWIEELFVNCRVIMQDHTAAAVR